MLTFEYPVKSEKVVEANTIGISYLLASTTKNEQLVSTGPILICGFGLATTLARTPSISNPELEYSPGNG